MNNEKKYDWLLSASCLKSITHNKGFKNVCLHLSQSYRLKVTPIPSIPTNFTPSHGFCIFGLETPACRKEREPESHEATLPCCLALRAGFFFPSLPVPSDFPISRPTYTAPATSRQSITSHTTVEKNVRHLHCPHRSRRGHPQGDRAPLHRRPRDRLLRLRQGFPPPRVSL